MKWARIFGALVILGFVTALGIFFAPHARAIFRMGDDLVEVYRFQKKISAPNFRDGCENWENEGLAKCLLIEIDRANLLTGPTSARRVMLHGAIVTSIGKAYRDKWDNRYRAYADAVDFLAEDLSREERRNGRVVALTEHDPRADEVFEPAKVEAAEKVAGQSLNGKIWRTYRERTDRMKEQGVSENLSGVQRQRLHHAYELMSDWERRIVWEKPN